MNGNLCLGMCISNDWELSRFITVGCSLMAWMRDIVSVVVCVLGVWIPLGAVPNRSYD